LFSYTSYYWEYNMLFIPNIYRNYIPHKGTYHTTWLQCLLSLETTK
jgi:hypothetical protein